MVSPLIVSLKRQKNFYGSKIRLLSPAKLNLYLNVVGKYPDGFHKIESVIERIPLFDELTIEVIRHPEIRIFSNEKSLENKNNLCFKVISILKKKFKFPFGFKIFLKKRIPIGAGLGGGSSNAASTFLGIFKLLDLKIELKELYRLGAIVGSDVNFFLSQSSYAFVCGRGERVFPFLGKKFSHLVIWPKVSLSTKLVYSCLQLKLTKFVNNVNMLIYSIKRGDLFLLKKSLFNALEKSAIFLCKELRELKEYLNSKNIVSCVSGSGSALYLVADRQLELKNIKKQLAKQYLVFEVNTF